MLLILGLVDRDDVFGRHSHNYCLGFGGKFFRSFLTVLLIFSCFFSGFALGSNVFEAVPRHTNCFVCESYILRSNWPT